FVSGYTGFLTPTTTRKIVVTHHEVPPPISDQDLAYIVGLYDGEIQYMDAQLGRLLEAVCGLQLKRDLVTVVTADHGEEFLDHGAFNHGYTLYEEQTSVPFIISAPSRLKPCRVSQQVRLIDAAPTLLDLAHIDISDTRFQGRSLLPLISGSKIDVPDAFSEATNFGGQYAIRSAASFKLIHSLTTQSSLLFDLRTDPRERFDLSAQHATQVQEMSARIDAWQERNRVLHHAIGASETALDHVVLDEKTQRGLQALGYIDP
ncbi:MAG: sulfatase-like hydrolase/transferase, partial [Acidobacteriota bacterium]